MQDVRVSDWSKTQLYIQLYIFLTFLFHFSQMQIQSRDPDLTYNNSIILFIVSNNLTTDAEAFLQYFNYQTKYMEIIRIFLYIMIIMHPNPPPHHHPIQ